MSWSPNWEPSGLPSNRHSSIFDLSNPRNGGHCTDARVVELNKSSVRMDHRVRQLPGTTFLPPIYGAIGLRRSPLSSFPGLPTMLSSVAGSRFPLPLSQNSHTDCYTSHTRPSLFSPLEDSSYYCSPMVPGHLVNQAAQSFKPPSFSSPASPRPSLHLHSTYLSSLPKRSKAALAVEDWDHPSFARPPHRAFESQSMDESDYRPPVVNQTDIDPAPKTSSALNVDQGVNDEPLVPNLYPVPPPPPYEQSAAPLSDLAADIVWERCYFSKTRPAVSPASIAHGPWDSTLSWSPSPGYPHQLAQIVDYSSHWSGATNTYGVIGAEAKARRFNRQYSSSASSPHSHSSNGSHHCRKLSVGTKMEVKPAFRRWTHQVLEQTLLSPQVLILALYYIDCVASTDVFGDGTSKLSLLPYKMLLSALVVANKTLDDHSYRNSTFANVSSMTNAEVNAIEAALLRSLNFNVVPTSEQWSNWLKDVIDAGERHGFHDPHVGLHSPLSRLVTSQHLNQQQDIRSPLPFVARSTRQGSIFDQAPTPDYVWHSHSESLGPVVDHKQFSSAVPSHSTGFDFRMQHTPVTFQLGGDYVGFNACVNIVPHHGHYSKSHYQQYN